MTAHLPALVDKATSSMLLSADWECNLQICDLLNSNSRGYVHRSLCPTKTSPITTSSHTNSIPIVVDILKAKVQDNDKDVNMRALELLEGIVQKSACSYF